MPRSRSSSTRFAPLVRPTGELALIDYIRQRAAATRRGSSAVRLGIGDDAAILAPPRGHEIVVTTDMSLEARHFRRDAHPARAVGHRTLARGLSDLAAMGARPLAAFLSLAIPRSFAADPVDSHWLNEFLDGLFALAATSQAPLAGGDTAESPSIHVLADIVLLGAVPSGKALRRSGASPGDRLFLTGSLGGSAAELATLTVSSVSSESSVMPKSRVPHSSAASLRMSGVHTSGAHPHLYPQPRLAAGQALLRRNLATACIDISDGLSTDLAHLCAASNVAAEIDAASLPIHALARASGEPSALRFALHGGEDYELLFTASPGVSIPRTLGGVPLTCIGSILRARRDQPTMTLIEAGGIRTPLEPHGWEHLR